MRYLIILSCIVFVVGSPTRNSNTEDLTNTKTDVFLGNSRRAGSTSNRNAKSDEVTKIDSDVLPGDPITAASSPTRNAKTEEVAKINTDEPIDVPRVEVSLVKTEDGLPKILIDITEPTNKEKDDVIAESREVEDPKTETKDDLKLETGEVGAKSDSEPRSTIHLHVPTSPNINVMPNKYQSQRPGYGHEGPYGPQPSTYHTMHKGKESKPYNQVNVYVYFPNDNSMMGINNELNGMQGEYHTGVHTYNYGDGTLSKSVTTPQPEKQPVEPCPVGFARIKGLCLEVDQRKRRVLKRVQQN